MLAALQNSQSDSNEDGISSGGSNALSVALDDVLGSNGGGSGGGGFRSSGDDGSLGSGGGQLLDVDPEAQSLLSLDTGFDSYDDGGLGFG